MKPIRMPKKLLKKWLTGLRSGQYKQGRGRMGSARSGYCCLGLLQRLVDGKVSLPEDCFPTTSWYEKNGITLQTEVKYAVGDVRNCDLPFRNFPPSFTNEDRYLCSTASAANDNAGITFPEIAELIELNVEGY